MSLAEHGWNNIVYEMVLMEHSALSRCFSLSDIIRLISSQNIIKLCFVKIYSLYSDFI